MNRDKALKHLSFRTLFFSVFFVFLLLSFIGCSKDKRKEDKEAGERRAQNEAGREREDINDEVRVIVETKPTDKDRKKETKTPALTESLEKEDRLGEEEGSEDNSGNIQVKEEEKKPGDVRYCTIWPIQDMDVYDDQEKKVKKGEIKGGNAYCVIGEKDGFFEILLDGKGNTGFTDSRFCMINLSEYLGKLCEYNITNSYSSVFRIHEYDIPDITGTVIPGFENVCISKDQKDFIVPFLYPCAQRLMKAAKRAEEDGYILCIYESYRPHIATRYLYDTVTKLLDEPLPDAEEEIISLSEEEMALANEQKKNESLEAARQYLLANGIDPMSPEALPIVQFFLGQAETVTAAETSYSHFKTYREEMTDNRFNLSAFLAKQVSAHNRGIALDLTMADKASREEFKMQSDMHDLSFNSISSSNNDNADLLSMYMTEAGFNGLSSEWWHFQDDITRKETGLNTYLEEGVSLEGFVMNGQGIRYRLKDGSFPVNEERMIDEVQYLFDEEGFCLRF